MIARSATRRRATEPLWWLLRAVALLFVLVLPVRAFALPVPPLAAHVNDNASMLSDAERAQLEQKLSDYERKTGRQFALLTIDSLAGDALESFSIRVVEAWKLGKKGQDSGLLLLVVKNDHQLRIEVGYGLEGSVTDAFSSRVIRNVLVPAFRAGKVAAGIGGAFDLLMEKAAGEDVSAPESAAPQPTGGRSGSPLGWIVLLFILAPFVIPLIFSTRRRGGGGGWGGGGWGGGGWGGGGSAGGGWGGGGGGGFSGGGGGFGGGGSSGSW